MKFLKAVDETGKKNHNYDTMHQNYYNYYGYNANSKDIVHDDDGNEILKKAVKKGGFQKDSERDLLRRKG